MDGFYIGYKPKGISSSKFVLDIAKSLKTKAGHTGTLDLEAEGIMIVALEQATKYMQYFHTLEKTYEARGILGIITDTKDIHGNIISKTSNINTTCDELKSILRLFKGNIRQIPPKYSAKKIKGKKAYELARSGKEVELKPIEVYIKSIELLECDIPYFSIKTTVSSGTYIRTLIEDIGNALDIGATTELIKRTSIGIFDQTHAGKTYSISEGMYFIKPIVLDASSIKSLKHGKILKTNEGNGIYKLLSKDNMFHGVVEIKDGFIKPLRMQGN